MAYVYMQVNSTFTIYSNGSIIPPSFKFAELHALTLAARSYVLLPTYIGIAYRYHFEVAPPPAPPPGLLCFYCIIDTV